MFLPIQYNPFRILGVYANAPNREIVANIGKMNAFLKIGKKVGFPTDFNPILGDLNRDNELVTNADSILTIDDDKTKAALFWFINITELDEAAFKQLQAGNLDEAVRQWSGDNGMSSLQNRAVCALIDDDVHTAALCLSKMYIDYSNEFLCAIEVNPDLDPDDLIALFVETLIENRPETKLSELIGPDCGQLWNETARRQLIEPITSQLNDIVNSTAKTEGNGVEDFFKAGQQLYKNALPLVQSLTHLLPENDVELVTASDKVAIQMMSCAISYFNNATSIEQRQDSLDLMYQAQPFAIGPMAIDRFNKNEQVMRMSIGVTPPIRVQAEDKELNKLLDDFNELYSEDIDMVQEFIREAKQMLKKIEKKVGKNDYYVHMSSLVVMTVMNRLVNELNEVMKSSSTGYYVSLSEKTQDLFDRLSVFCMDEPTRKHFEDNYFTLNNNNEIDIQHETTKDDISTWGYIKGFFGFALIVFLIIRILKNCF